MNRSQFEWGIGVTGFSHNKIKLPPFSGRRRRRCWKIRKIPFAGA
jgi:hypothetical protein